jgi:hypothetical protein
MNKKSYKDILDSAVTDSLSRNSDLWPKLSAQIERNSPMMTPRTRPFAAVLITILALLVVSSATYALGRTLGYLPGIGLVDNSSGLRELAEPVAVTREGVTLTISNVYVYPDRVEVVYDVNGLAPDNDSTKASDAVTTPTAFCGGGNIGDTPYTDGDARLQLPDGALLQRDQTGKYPQNVFATKPVYAATVSANVMKMTMVLDCIPFARRGAAPEHWSVPFELKAVPAGKIIGVPVTEINATSVPVATQIIPAETALVAPVATEPISDEPAPVPAKLTFTLVQSVQLASGPVFYLQLHVENPAPEMVTALPRDVFVIDSQGQKIQYINNSQYPEDPAAVWEYVPTAKPAAGPLRLVLNDAVLKFAPLNPVTFSFDAGSNPQYDQTWILDKEFDIAGYKVMITSVRAANFDDIKDIPDSWDPNGGPDFPEGSQGFDNGYQFTVKPGTQVSNQQLDILSDACGLTDIRDGMPASNRLYTQLCRDGYPKGQVNVILRSLSIVVSNIGQVTWSPNGTVTPAQP